MKGIFISMEGPDGSGKTTQIELLKKYLNDKGYYDIATWYFKETARLCIRLYDSFKGNSENIYYLKKYINKQKKLALSLMIRHYSISAKIVFVLFLSSFHLYKVIYKLKK